MKALVLESYMNLVYKEMPTPTITDDEVFIRVRACGICGSDVHGLDGSTGRRIPPLIMGHEASGDIVEIGSNVTEWHIGDRVTFDSTIYKLGDWYTRRGMYNLSDGRMVLGVSPGEYRRHGAFAEFVAVPQHILYHLPEGVSYNQAAMVEPGAVALHAVELTPLNIGDSAVVIGAGMIGLFIIQMLRIKGCGRIIAVDPQQKRRDLAIKLGADTALPSDDLNFVEQIKTLTSGRGADSVFEAVGIKDAVKNAIASVRRGGTVTLVGNLSPTVELPLQSVVTQQIRLQGSCAIAGEYAAVLELIASGRLNVDSLLSATAPLSEGASWFKKLYEKDQGLMKVILNP